MSSKICTVYAFILLIVVASMMSNSGAAVTPLSAHSLDQKIKRAILSEKLDGVRAIHGTITKVEAICSSEVCTASKGSWIVNVDEKLPDDLGKKLTVEIALLDIETVDQAAYTSGVRVEWVDFEGSLSMTDQYGNISDQVAIRGRLLASAAQKIRWNNLTPQMLWMLQTQTYIFPELQQYLSDNLESE
jgi:hypothetical protein